MSAKTTLPMASPFLERALLFSFVIHVLAMFSMALCLLPGLPGGGVEAVELRGQYVAEHPWLWRLGWLPWQLTALSDVLIGIALVRTSWVPRLPAIVTLLATLAAAGPEQTFEMRWVTGGVARAAQSQQAGDWEAYRQFETTSMLVISGWGGTMYTLMAIAWSWTFAAAGTWSRRLTVLSVVTWPILLASGVVLFLPAESQPGPFLVAVGNALGLGLLLVWLALVTEAVLRRSRPDEPHGRLAPWAHPRRDLLGRAFETLGNSRFARALGEWVPPVAFVSDITDVIYVNYLVDAARLEALVPWGLELQRLGPGGKYALYTFLSYRHGHFGPRVFGPLRRLLPSPVQSNWRVYVRDPQTGKEGIYFFTNAIDRTLHALSARLLSEGMPMHVLAAGAVIAEKDGSFTLRLDPGAGSAPDADAHLRPTQDRTLPPPWNECFDSYRAMLAYCVPQDRALSSQTWCRRITRQEIQLGIPLDICEPLTGEVKSKAAQAHVGDAAALCFRVAHVSFRFEREEYDYRAE